MRYRTLLATAALALALPFILAHCASLLSERLPLTYDAKSVGGPNSSAPLQLYLPPGNGPFPAVLVMHSCSGITDNTRSWASRLVGWGYAAVIVDSFGPRNQRRICDSLDLIPVDLRAQDCLYAQGIDVSHEQPVRLELNRPQAVAGQVDFFRLGRRSTSPDRA